MEDGKKVIHAYWIHHTKQDAASVSGFLYLPECDCSNCHGTVGVEKPVCPFCGALMDGQSQGDVEGVEVEPAIDTKD